MYETPDLSKSFHPQPKQYRKKKEHKGLGVGKKSQNWYQGREELLLWFEKRGITTCEIQLEGCLQKLFTSFAHVKRRGELTAEETRNPNYVVLACQPCHHTVDYEMRKEESYKLLEAIVDKRGRV